MRDQWYCHWNNYWRIFNRRKYTYEFQLDEILFIGDDVPDIPVLQKVGLSACPVDSIQEVLSMVDYVSPFQGGRGAVRDILEKLLKVKDLWTLDHELISG